MVMQFPATKNAGCLKAQRDFPPRKDGILPPRRVILELPSPFPKVYTGGRTYADVTTKISRIESLRNLLSNGAWLAGFACGLRY